MVIHPGLGGRRLRLRQTIDIPSTGTGIDSSASLVIDPTGGSGAGTLALDTNAPSGAIPTTGIPLAPSFTPTTIFTPTPSPSSSTTQLDPPSTSSPTSHAGGLSTPAVIAGCIVALVGAIFLVLVGIVLYRRYMKSLQRSYRNATADAQRRRSRLEPWSKLDDSQHDSIRMKEAEPMDKMFKKAPSVRTAYTHKSDEPMNLGIPHSLAQYHPELAKHGASSEAVTVRRPFLGRAESGPTISWNADTLHDVASQQLAATPTGNSGSIAIPTPIATRTLHRWQSAEVFHPDGEATVAASNPFETESERRKSGGGNPFFKGQDYPTLHMRTRSNSSASSHTHKAKDRVVKAESFASDLTTLPQFTMSHTASSSTSSAMNNPHAIRTLIAALNVTEEEIQDRLRVVSMQPSTVSMQPSPVGTESSTGGLELAASFPLPPSRDGHFAERYK